MAARTVTDDSDAEERPDVSAHYASPERTVFTETGNREGWIATDTTVELEP